MPGPQAPSEEERAAREVLRSPPAPWCLACQLGNTTSKPRRKLTFDQQDIGQARVVLDFTYMKTTGEFADPGEVPAQADRFSVTLLMVDRGTQMSRASPAEAKELAGRMANRVAKFLDKLEHSGHVAQR